MIHVYVNGARRGPFTDEQVRSFLRDGLLQPADLASTGLDADLKPLATFGDFVPSTAEARSVDIVAVDPEPGPLQVRTLPLSRSPENNLAPIPIQSLGPYARATLSPNETPVYKTSLHWIVFARFGALAILAFLFIAMPFAIAVQALTGSQIGWFALPLPAFMMIPPTLAFISSELVISDARVLIKTGVVRRQTLEMFISKVESIAIDQGFLARVFDYGTVNIRGTGGFEEPFEAIARPIEFRNWVQRMQKGSEPARGSTTAPS